MLVLLLHGMDPQTQNKDKHTALHVACGNCSEQPDASAVVFTLLKYGAKVDIAMSDPVQQRWVGKSLPEDIVLDRAEAAETAEKRRWAMECLHAFSTMPTDCVIVRYSWSAATDWITLQARTHAGTRARSHARTYTCMGVDVCASTCLCDSDNAYFHPLYIYPLIPLFFFPAHILGSWWPRMGYSVADGTSDCIFLFKKKGFIIKNYCVV